MSKVSQLKKLYDNSREAGKSLKEYKDSVRQSFGIKLSESGLGLDAEKQIVNPRDISFQELAYEFLGRDYASVLQEKNLQEVSGGANLPSAQSNISGWDATAFGLLDALILEGYNNPVFIWDKMVTTEQTRTNGGKSIRTTHDANTGIDLAPGEEAPASGLNEMWVTRNRNIRRAHKVQVTLESILYDHTDTIQTSAYDSGALIANAIEIHVAKTLLGVDNTFSMNGTAGNTYLTAKGTGVMNYKNGESNALTSYASIQTAMATMSANYNPFTGIPIYVDPAKASILVPLAKLYDTRAILHATQVWKGTSVTADFNNVFTANPLESNYTIMASPIWDKVIADNSLTTFAYLFGEFPRAFGYRQLVPFSTISAPLGPKEVTSNIALCVYAQEIGAVYVKEPRYTYKATTA